MRPGDPYLRVGRVHTLDVNKSRALLGEAAQFPTLEHVFRWAMSQQPRLEPVDVVIQDEYTHDVLFAASDGSCLVFDAT